MATDQERAAACKVLMNHPNEISRISSRLPSLLFSLRQIDLTGWRREGHDLVNWMRNEADAMAKDEKDVAITKVSGGAGAIAGGLLSGVGIVTSFFTFGLTAPLAVLGGVVSAAAAATSAGGAIAQHAISQTKVAKIKERCEAFGQITEGVLSKLVEMGQLMSELSNLCQQQCKTYNIADISGVMQIVLQDGFKLGTVGYKAAQAYKISMTVYQIMRLQRSGVIFSADFLALAARTIAKSGASISKALFTGALKTMGIGFGIWDVVDGANTLQSGGPHSALIRDNASKIDHTIREIDKVLRLLDL